MCSLRERIAWIIFSTQRKDLLLFFSKVIINPRVASNGWWDKFWRDTQVDDHWESIIKYFPRGIKVGRKELIPVKRGKKVGNSIKVCKMIQPNVILVHFLIGRGEGRVISIRILLWSGKNMGGSTPRRSTYMGWNKGMVYDRGRNSLRGVWESIRAAWGKLYKKERQVSRRVRDRGEQDTSTLKLKSPARNRPERTLGERELGVS